MTANYRVVQWATGNIGTKALRGVLDHPRLTLAGLYAYSADKAGRDAGELCGRDPVGVTATNSVEEILELGADCLLYMPLACDMNEVCRILSAGTNIVTTRGEFHFPDQMDPVARAAVEAACAQGKTSIHSTGSSPGFITEAVPLALTSIQRRLDHLAINEYADLSQRDSPALLFQVMGFGAKPSTFDQNRANYLRDSFGPSLRLLASSLGLPLDTIDAAGEVAVATERLTIAAGVIEAGTVAAQRVTLTGRRDGRSLLTFRATWYCSTDVEPAWDMRATGWNISVEGDAPLDVDLRFPFPLDRMAELSPGYTANRAVNAVPFVCDAAPGIRTTLDLPTIVAALG